MELIEAFAAYPDIAKPIILKLDIMRVGLKVSQAMLDEVAKIKDLKLKQYEVFRLDRAQDALSSKERVPQYVFLEDGTEDGMLFDVRISEETPYLLDFIDGEFVVKWNGEKVAKIMRFGTRGKYADRYFEDGTPYGDYVWTNGDDKLGCIPNRFCRYFSMKKQCLYCDFTPVAVEWKKSGGAVTMQKDPEKAAEVFDVALHEKRFRNIHFSGGTVLAKIQGMTEVDWYCNFLNTIRRRIYTWPPTIFQIQALDDENWKKIYDTGISNIQPNIEVMDKKLFEIICPGKNEVVGYDEWIKRTISAAKYFGGENVNPNIVWGVEMAQPFGFKKWEEAVKSAISGYKFWMSNGILIRQGSMWCIEPDTKLGGQPPIPLEYYLETSKAYLELREKYGFFNCPTAMSRASQATSAEYDMEYFHGHGAASREAEKKSLARSQKIPPKLP
jgi:hypothetical protein